MSRRTGSAWTTSPNELGLRMRTFKGHQQNGRMTARGRASAAKSQPFGQSRGEAGIEDFFLGLGDVIIEPAQFDRGLVHVVNDVSGFGIIIAGLTDGADVDEIFFTGLNLELGVGATADHAVADEGDRDMGMAEEADGSVLVGKAGGGGEFVEDIPPALGSIESGMDNSEAGDHAHVFELAKPLSVFGGELASGPVDRFCGGRIKTVKSL